MTGAAPAGDEARRASEADAQGASSEHEDPGFAEFLAVLQQEESAMPREVYAQIEAAMQKRWANPPLADLEAVLKKAVSVEKARQLLFYPDDDDMRLYAQHLLASAPPGSPETHPQAKLQVQALASTYLVHGRCWARVKPFIEEGGLLRLVDLLQHPNLYLASQAMQCLLHATDEEIFPWHDPPLPPDGRSVKQGPDALVWRRMYELTRSLIPSLLKHQNPDTFPGSGLLALRLLAFTSSWLRYHFTPDRVLRLSAGLLDLLKEWSTREGAGEEERQLAKQLYEDFSRFPPAVAAAAPQLGSGTPGGGEAEATSLADAELDALEVHTVRERTHVNHVAPGQAEELRQQGNDAYRKGDYTTAINRYSQALDVPVPAADLLTEGPRRATVLSNRAAAYLARAAAGGGAPGEVDDYGHLEGRELGTGEARAKHWDAALLDASAALDLQPSHLKATFRKAQALYWLQRYPEALEAAERAQLLAEQAASDAPSAAASAMAAEVESLCDEIERCLHDKGGAGAAAAAGQLRGAQAQDDGGGVAAGLESLLTVTGLSSKQASGGKAPSAGAAAGGIGAVRVPVIEEIAVESVLAAGGYEADEMD